MPGNWFCRIGSKLPFPGNDRTVQTTMKEFRKRAPLLAAILLAAAAGCAAPEPRPRTSQTFPPPAPKKAPVERPAPLPAPPEARPEAAPVPPAAAGDIAGHFRKGDYRQVVEEFEMLLQRYPSHLKGADDLYYLGMSHYYLEEDDYALKSFLEFQYRFPGDPRAGKLLLVTAKVFRRMDRNDRALDTHPSPGCSPLRGPRDPPSRP
jgi:TolA-binding protein